MERERASEEQGGGSWRAAVENVVSLVLALAAVVATFVVKDRFQSNCSPSSPYCKVNLGAAGIVKIPTVIAFRSKEHGTYLKAQPAAGGIPMLDEHSHALGSLWELTEENDQGHVSLRSYHGTYLSCGHDPEEGFAMATYAGRKETYFMEVFARKADGDALGSRTSACFVCMSSGMYLTPNPDGTLSQRPLGEGLEPAKFHLETRSRGRYALRASLETDQGEPLHFYLAATEPERRAELIQGPDFDEWAYFVLDRGLIKGQFILESAHGAFLLPVAGNRVGALSQERADGPMMWGVTVGLEGMVGLQAVAKGQWVWAMDDGHTVVLLPEYARFKPSAMFEPLVIGKGISLNDPIFSEALSPSRQEGPRGPAGGAGAEGGDPAAGAVDGGGGVDARVPAEGPGAAGAEGVEKGDASQGGAGGAAVGKEEETLRLQNVLSADW